MGSTWSRAIMSVDDDECYVCYGYLAAAKFPNDPHVLGKKFGRVGEIVTDHSWKLVLVSLLLIGGLSSLVIFRIEEGRTEKIWVPQESEAIEHSAYVTDNYGASPRVSTYILRPRGSGLTDPEDILTTPHLTAAFDVQQAVLDISVTYKGENKSLTDFCVTTIDCLTLDVMDYWNNVKALVAVDPAPKTTLSKRNATDIFGQTLSTSGIVGGEERNGMDIITLGSALKFTFFTKGSELEGGDNEQIALLWEQAFIDLLLEHDESSTDFDVYVNAARSVTDALSSAIRGDLGLLALGYGALAVFVCINIGKLDRVRSRAGLAIMGLLVVLSSTQMAYGLGAALGVLYVPSASIVPFIVLGIGVDDMFILVDQYELTNSSDPVRRRMRDCFSHSGVGIMTTSVTTFASFLAGSATQLPAIQSFCYYAAMAIFFNFVLMLFMFGALMAIDARRMEQHRVDFFCCVKTKPRPDVAGAARSMYGDSGPLPYYLDRYYTPFLLKPGVKVAVILAFIGLAAFGVVGAMQLRQDFSVTDLAPDDSYVIPYINQNEQWYGDGNLPVSLYFRASTQWPTTLVRGQVQDLLDDVEADSFVTGGVDSWYYSYLDFLNTTASGHQAALIDGMPPNSNDFYNWLDEYLSAAGQRFSSDIVWIDEADFTKGLQSSRFGTSFVPLPDAATQVDALNSIRSVYDKHPEIDGFAFNGAFLFFEQFAIIISEAIQNLAIAAAAVFIVTNVMLVHPLTAFLVVLMVLLIDLSLLGVMFYWGVDVDSISVANLVIAVGLAVDYSVHIAHSFMLATGTRDERVRLAMRTMGTSVISGAVSTFLGVFPLALASSAIFRTFFKLFFGTIILGLGHGIILLPVLLSWVGPAPATRDVMGPTSGKKLDVVQAKAAPTSEATVMVTPPSSGDDHA